MYHIFVLRVGTLLLTHAGERLLHCQQNTGNQNLMLYCVT